MSPARADQVNAVELAARSATLERELDLGNLPRLREAGAQAGSHARALLQFGSFEGRPTVQMQIEASIVLTCQRCLQPCDLRMSESAMVMVVADEAQEVAGGYEPVIADPERLPVGELIEEQLLLGMPLVPMHGSGARCPDGAGDKATVVSDAKVEDRQRPFANLRELLDKSER